MENNLQTISNEEINHLPLFTYKGALELITESKLVEKAMAEISQHAVVGFDTETRPAFVSGTVYKVALAQVATENKVYLFRLHHTGIPDAMHTFFENEKITKAGIALRDDLKALQKIRNFTPNGFFDLATVSKPAGFDAAGIKKLAALLLKVRISKGAQTSNWEAEKLNERQIRYAATDAWISLKIHEKIMTLVTK